jgi:hypothetical protein
MDIQYPTSAPDIQADVTRLYAISPQKVTRKLFFIGISENNCPGLCRHCLTLTTKHTDIIELQ